MTVLVTGGCGYIGAHVVHALHQAGEKVVVVDDQDTTHPARSVGGRMNCSTSVTKVSGSIGFSM